MTCKAAIERTKEAVPAEATLIAFFDNALPNSYSSIRQLVRRQKHETLLQHYTDYQIWSAGNLLRVAPNLLPTTPLRATLILAMPTLEGLKAEDASFASAAALSIALAAGSAPSLRLSAHSAVPITVVLSALRPLAVTAAANSPVGPSSC